MSPAPMRIVSGSGVGVGVGVGLTVGLAVGVGLAVAEAIAAGEGCAADPVQGRQTSSDVAISRPAITTAKKAVARRRPGENTVGDGASKTQDPQGP
jgi:hypothetical protein